MATKKVVSKTTITRTTSTSGTSSSKSSGGTKQVASSSITKDLIRGGVAVLALTAALSYSFVKTAVVDMGVFLGDLQPLNTAGCEPVKGLQACEDIHIHHPSGLAFATCGNAESRKSWYPPMGATNASATESAFQDNFVIYDISTGAYEVKELVGLPAGTDRVFHGLGVFERSATELTIFAVNHRRTGSVVEVLEYTVGDSEVRYIETIQHDLIYTPNDIVATGPRSFYVSNDHRHPTGAMRHAEELLRRPWSNVIYYSPERVFVAFEGVASANGITGNLDNSRLYLSACHGAGVHVLEPREDHSLDQVEFIKLDFYNDNPSLDPKTGDIFITGHVQVYKMAMDFMTPGKVIVGPSKVVKLSKNPLTETSPSAPKHVVDTVLLDDGHLISTGTVAAVDRKRGVMLIGTAFGTQGLIRCPIPQSA
ncbi:Serum paraoxonase/arylesterase 2 [Mortierella alpina]|nr:Serum paraoxonase/arylesterase 2 [Mortierella alpina]